MKILPSDKLTWKQTLNVPVIVRRLLFLYINWERMWYNPKCKFKRGDKITVNWKYKIYARQWGKDKFNDIWTFDTIDELGVIEYIEGDAHNGKWINIYWVKSANKKN